MQTILNYLNFWETVGEYQFGHPYHIKILGSDLDAILHISIEIIKVQPEKFLLLCNA